MAYVFLLLSIPQQILLAKSFLQTNNIINLRKNFFIIFNQVSFGL